MILGMQWGVFVALILGAACIGSVLIVFVVTHALPSGGLSVLLVGLILMTFTQWERIKLGVDGVELKTRVSEVEKAVQETKATVRETAGAAAEVAEHSQQTANAVAETNRKVTDLATKLGQKELLPKPTINEFQQLKPPPMIDPAVIKKLENFAIKPITPLIPIKPK